ncbi:hypothetical protein, partial [Parasutterella sp.]|uniref:hypothetical protein n=1 Tax=Parasutterella sp. TaxID=2049037 RepID=UPI003AB14224
LPVVHDVQQTLEFLHAFEVGGGIAAAGKGTAPHEAVVIQAVRNEQEAGGVTTKYENLTTNRLFFSVKKAT